jgi:hypothetical protein
MRTLPYFAGVSAWLWIVLCLHAQAGGLDKAAVEQEGEARAVFVKLSELANKCMEGREPVDGPGFLELLKKGQGLAKHLDEESRGKLIDIMGRFFLQEYEQLPTLLEGHTPRGISVYIVIRLEVFGFLSGLNDKRVLPFFEKFCEVHAREIADDPKGFASQVASRVKTLGGKLAVGSQSAPTSRPESEKIQREVDEILRKLADAKSSDPNVAQSVRRLGELGDRRAVSAVVKLLQSPNLHWIVRQDGMWALGMLGGDEAQQVLIKELTKPMPPNASIDDYGEIEAICRSYAAMALGKCGDIASIQVLEQCAMDKYMYKRVREACRQAALKVKKRTSTTTGRQAAGS